MKNYIYTLFLLILLSIPCHKGLLAQHAQFETSIYFEDAVGNRDTIIIGADTSAQDGENSHLGMYIISTP